MKKTKQIVKRVSVMLREGHSIEGYVYVVTPCSHDARATRVQDLLNDGRAFIPVFVIEDFKEEGDILGHEFVCIHVNKAMIIMVNESEPESSN